MRVIDKRRYTPEGELREDYRASTPEQETDRDPPAADPAENAASTHDPQAAAPAPATGASPSATGVGASAPVPGEPVAGERGATSRSNAMPPPDFIELLELVAQPALLYLGDLTLPDGRSAENLPMARRQIDLIEVLKGRTKGNLSSQESAILEDLLYRLRLRYVQKTS